jgi:hypothetical protein
MDSTPIYGWMNEVSGCKYYLINPACILIPGKLRKYLARQGTSVGKCYMKGGSYANTGKLIWDISGGRLEPSEPQTASAVYSYHSGGSEITNALQALEQHNVRLLGCHLW